MPATHTLPEGGYRTSLVEVLPIEGGYGSLRGEVLPFEEDAGEYDCIRANPRDKRAVLVHDAKLARNGRQIDMTHHHFVFDKVFDETASNSTVFASEVR